MNEIVGVFREEQEGEYVTYSFRTITNEEYKLVTKGETCQASCPDAAFWVSSTPFAGAEKIKWQFTDGQIVFADRIVINDAMATEIIPDVVSDMIVEDAIMRAVDVLRIKIEKQSPVSTSLQECDMSIVDSDNNYYYFEIDVREEAVLRMQEDNNQESELEQTYLQEPKEELPVETENIVINIDLSSFLNTHSREELMAFLGQTEETVKEEENLITKAINQRMKDLNKTVDSLQSLLAQPIGIENTIAFFNNSDFEEIASKIPNEKGIYFFTAEQKAIENLYEAFQKVREKESKQGEAFAKLNTDVDLKASDCIYVGSSAELRKRFEQHVKKCYKKTYAIKFYKWLPDEIEIKFHYYCLEDIDADVLQNIEEGLREIRKPVLGKSGK